MAGIGYVSALLLAVVLAWAAAAKVWRPRSTTASFEALGLPAPMLLARTVPVAEAVCALVLVARPRLGAAAALVLLGGFTAVLARALVRRPGVACACFGAASMRPVAVSDLVRNGSLAAAAATALTVPAPVVPALVDVVVVTTAAAVTGVGLAAWQLRESIGHLWSNRLAGEPQ